LNIEALPWLFFSKGMTSLLTTYFMPTLLLVVVA
jgi:hypothetical protein